MKATDFSKYPHMPFVHRAIVRELDMIIADENVEPRFRSWAAAVRVQFLEGSMEYEQLVSASKELGYRLPDFDGDMMGRPADD